MSNGRESGGGRQLCRCQCHPDLSWLHFGHTKIAVSDVDLLLYVVERRNQFLFIEWKAEREEVPEGQKILLSALSLLPGVTVLVVRGSVPEGVPSSYCEMKNGSILEPIETSREDFIKRTCEWFDRIEARAKARWPKEG